MALQRAGFRHSADGITCHESDPLYEYRERPFLMADKKKNLLKLPLWSVCDVLRPSRELADARHLEMPSLMKAAVVAPSLKGT